MALKLGLVVVSLLAIWSMPASSEVNSFSKGLQKFSTQFYQTAAKKYTGNIVTSPYSVQTAFLLMLMGAKDKTADEIKQVFGLSALSRSDIEAAYSTYRSSFTGNNFFKVANKIYAAHRYTLKPSFVDIATKTFGSEATTIDFEKNNEAADEINGWVQKETNGKIRDIITASEFDSNSRVFLANAVYFKGEWEKQFKLEDTKPEPFWIKEDESVEVDTMRALENFKTGHFNDFSAIELNYKDSDLSMMILLPFSRTGIDNLEGNLANIDIFELSKNMSDNRILLRLPKFKIETELELTELFKQMGVERMFTDLAEFDDLFDVSEEVTVGSAVQKAFIEIDEKGSEAAAVTGVTIVAIRANPEIKVDHPFIYVIKNSEAVLFMGSVKKF